MNIILIIVLLSYPTLGTITPEKDYQHHTIPLSGQLTGRVGRGLSRAWTKLD